MEEQRCVPALYRAALLTTPPIGINGKKTKRQARPLLEEMGPQTGLGQAHWPLRLLPWQRSTRAAAGAIWTPPWHTPLPFPL